MSSRLQPILLLDPSVSHTPLLTGKFPGFSRGGAGPCILLRAKPGKGPFLPTPLQHPHPPCLPAESLPPHHPVPLLPSIPPFGSLLMPHPHPILSSARAWAPALPLCPVLTDHRAALWVRPPPATKPDPLRAPAPKCHRPPTAGPPAAPPGPAQTSRPADQGEGNWVGEVMRGCSTGPLGLKEGRLRKGEDLVGQREDMAAEGQELLKSQQDEWPASLAHHGPLYTLNPRMASQWASPLPRGQPSQVRSPDCGRYPQLRT